MLMICNRSVSQIFYSHYLDQTSEWSVLNRDTNNMLQNLRYETIFFSGFEDINGLTYHKMYKTYYSIGYSYDFSAIAYPQSSNFTQFIGYFREDNTGKFYIKYSVGSNEIIYFDNQGVINSQVGGDYFQHYDGSTNPYCPSGSIGSMVIAGLNSKTLFSGTDVFSGGSAIEGVGMIFNDCYAPTFVDNNYAGPFKRIHCYTKQGQTYSFYGNYNLPNNIAQINCSTFPVANRQNLNNTLFDESKVYIYPNPAESSVTIASKDRMISIIVFDIHGRQILTNNVNGTEIAIDVSNFEKGSYLVQVNTENGNSISKLIKY